MSEVEKQMRAGAGLPAEASDRTRFQGEPIISPAGTRWKVSFPDHTEREFDSLDLAKQATHDWRAKAQMRSAAGVGG